MPLKPFELQKAQVFNTSFFNLWPL